MVFDYLITIKKRDYKFVDQVSQLMNFFSIVAFGFFYYQAPRSGTIYLFIIIGIVISWGVSLMKRKKDGKAFFRLGLLFGAAGWLLGPQRNILMGILYAIAAAAEKQVKFPQEIGFTKEAISFNSIPKRTLDWSGVNNVIIKDGLITIDQKNNKIYQKEIEGYVTTEIENEFNQFCKACIDLSPAGSDTV